MDTTTTDAQQILELAEARAWSQLYRHAGEATAKDLGVAVFTVGPATAVMAGRVDILAHNRVIGLGLGVPVGDDTVDAIVDAFAAVSARRFFVQLSPYAAPGTSELLEERGFRYYNDWVKLSRDAAMPVAAGATDLDVECIDASRAGEFARVFVDAFDWPRALEPWLATLVGRPGWRHYLALDGGRGVATSAMYVDGDVAWIDFASTLPDYRGRGAQSAMLARRIEECAALGVRTVVAETADTGASRRNLERMGFTWRYRRANYLLELE